jgi:hypothetical protein
MKIENTKGFVRYILVDEILCLANSGGKASSKMQDCLPDDFCHRVYFL